MLHHGGKKIAFIIIENKEAKFPQAFLFRISSWTGNLPTEVCSLWFCIKNIVASFYFPHYTNSSWCGANLDSLVGTPHMLHHGGKKIAFLITENIDAKFPQAFLFRISSWTGNLPTGVCSFWFCIKNIVASFYFPHYTNHSWCGANLDSLV